MSHIYSRFSHAVTDVVEIGGSFTPQGASAPTKVAGKGWSVAYSATGKYVITLTDRSLPKFVDAHCSLGMGSPNGSQVNFVTTSGAVYDSTNRQLTIIALDGSNSAVALDASSGGGNDGSVVCFSVRFSKSTLPVT